MLHYLQRLASKLGLGHAPRYPYPALDFHLPAERYLHLVGSIHMGNKAMSPISSILLEKLKHSDALIVEADLTQTDQSLLNLTSEIPLVSKLPYDIWQQLQLCCREIGLSVHDLDDMPAWRAALVLQAQQAYQLGLRAEYGVDYQLLEWAHQHHIPVRELEGANTQVQLLKNLPEEGIELLEGTLQHWHTNARLLQIMLDSWLNPARSLQSISLPQTFNQTLFQTLIIKRNQNWHDELLQLPAGNYVVAVGALHLYGKHNLPQLFNEKSGDKTYHVMENTH